MTLESTRDYWRIWFFVLEAAGLAVQLVNSGQARKLAGRPKTGKLDAQWLARLTERGCCGLVRAAGGDPGAAGLHPGPDPADPGADPVLAAAGETAGRRAGQGLIGGVHADHGLGPGHGQGVIAGQRDPRALAGLARTRMRARHDDLVGPWTACSMTTTASCRVLLDQIAFLDTRIAQLGARSPSWSRRCPKPGASTRTGPPARPQAPPRRPRC